MAGWNWPVTSSGWLVGTGLWLQVASWNWPVSSSGWLVETGCADGAAVRLQMCVCQ